jgi:hypothetical protein
MRFPVLASLAALTLAAPLAAQSLELSGIVLSSTKTPIAGARIVALSGDDIADSAFSGLQGEFTLTLSAHGPYRIEVEKTGFFALKSQVDFQPSLPELELTLEPVRDLVQSVAVTASSDTVDMDSTSVNRSLGIPEILNIPYPRTNDLRSALRILPGVIRDNRGGLHIAGGAEEQTLYTLNGFNLNDPLTGRLETRFSIEAVQSADVASGNLPAEFGKGSAGQLAIRTTSGDDSLRLSATNFFPGFENRKGWTLTDFTPRFGFSGPIKKGNAWYSNSSDVQYVKTIVRDAPDGADRTASFRFSNISNFQVNLAPNHILFAGYLYSKWNAARTGLTALDPWETTIDRRSRQDFFHIKDQYYFRNASMIELGYAANRSTGREIPQGSQMLAITPLGKRGNHFVNADRSASRDQFLLNAILPTFRLAGAHHIKAGSDLNRVTYWQNVRRTGFEQFSDTGVRLYKTTFFGSGQLNRRNFESALYLQDSWRPRQDVLVELGFRLDHDTILKQWSPSPRIGLAWSPGDNSTKIFAGVSRIYDASALRLFSRPLDQYWLTTYFQPNGQVGRGPQLSLFTINNQNLLRPAYDGANFGFERHFARQFSLRGDYLFRRGRRGFTYLNTLAFPDQPDFQLAVPPGLPNTVQGLDAVYDLFNARRDRFRSYSVTARHIFKGQYQWMASYTQSRALSNAVIDVNADDPVSAADNTGPLPWDAPHRFVSWGYLPLKEPNWAISYLTEYRTGFPFSVRDDFGSIEGKVNSRRFPSYFELNLHIERKFQFRGHLWAFRFGANNLTDRINPDSVNNIAGSPKFLTYYGGNGRTTNFRIRWLGKAPR